ncbi:hypothetical protein [Leuconostoc mesenteroides]|uniref:hypothetical protein n=1 Tax=Leuconostoc mesenteroides TaxID=1245 RepID=UPI001CBE49EC|nr:hypothetical protein [Leuconostoc mesenteroides]
MTNATNETSITNENDDKAESTKVTTSSSSSLPKTGTSNASVLSSLIAILVQVGLLAGLRTKYRTSNARILKIRTALFLGHNPR